MQGRKIPPNTWKTFPRLLAENGGSITTTANQLSIDPRSVYYHIRRNPTFAENIREIYDNIVVPILEQQMYALALAKDYRAMRFILANRAPRRWNTEFVLRNELEIELERKKKEIKSGEQKTYTSKYPSLSALVLKNLYENHLLGVKEGGDLPDKIVLDLRGNKAHYESYRTRREERLKSHPEEK